MKRTLLLISVVAAMLFASCESKKVETFKEADDPVALSKEEKAAWESVKSGLNAAWGTPNLVYSRSLVPQNLTPTYATTAWRGEKVSAQVVLWTAYDFQGVECVVSDFESSDATLPASIAEAHFVRYTIGDKSDKSCLCGRPNGHPAILQADMLDTVEAMDIPANSVRPVWITVAVPQDAKAGTYKANVEISHSGVGTLKLPLEVEVVDQELAKPKDWKFHLDLWQHPAAVARVAGVEVWSDAHYEAMRPVMQMLADAGQKVITATLNRDPWQYQCFDDYEPMIYWSLYDNDVWKYDYSRFDKWVEFMMSLGIDKQINCYGMLPWGKCTLDYQDMRSDAKDNRNRKITTTPQDPEYEKVWGPFLTDFAKHLKEKGWLEKTNMAIDERKPEDMDVAAAMIAKYAPELGFAMADNHDSYKRYANMRDVCVGQRHSVMAQEEIAARRANGDVSTFYVCCSTLFPNAFTNSQPYESELLCLYAVAHDYDGMLRWAYNSWPANPQYDSRFRYWASGDTYIVYPGGRSSVRFERLIDGIELFEKIHTLRAKAGENKEVLAPVEAKLAEMRERNLNDASLNWTEFLAEVNAAVNDAAKQLAK
ncbi:MAG: DUF4091 domain-containing protein [Alistipes sp.]|nr:DUF4091 domain-containing protein [Alistipes sp.]